MIVLIGPKKIPIILDEEDYVKFFLEGFGFGIDRYGYVYRRKYLRYENGHSIEERVSLHRLIMNPPQSYQVDHINQNKTDNRKENLRICTHAENQRNKKSLKGFKGVNFEKNTKKWKARITIDGTQHWLGRFKTAKEAAIAYNKMAQKLHGKFAYLNVVV